MTKKTLNKIQEEILMECHERILLGQQPLSTYYARYSKGLLTRGFLDLRTFNNGKKLFIGFTITEKGINYLDENLQ